MLVYSPTACANIMTTLQKTKIETPLGPMIAISDADYLYQLTFSDLSQAHEIISGENKISKMITSELKNYFDGKYVEFRTPVKFIGTDFQKNVWKKLQTIPVGKTISYLTLAEKIKKPTAYRAIANANGANPLAIIVPCHRVVRENGELGGYNGGASRKAWLIQHEKKVGPVPKAFAACRWL